MFVLDKKEQETYREYKLSRDAIQLLDTTVIDCSAKHMGKVVPDKANRNLSVTFYCKQEKISATTREGYLKAKVRLVNAESKEAFAEFLVECKGMFELKGGQKMEESEYEKRLELQIVPQLLPYIRSAIASLSSLVRVPVILPTMDVLESIRQNR